MRMRSIRRLRIDHERLIGYLDFLHSDREKNRTEQKETLLLIADIFRLDLMEFS